MNKKPAHGALLCALVAIALGGSCALAAPSTHVDKTSTAERSWQAPRLLETSRGDVFEHEIAYDANGNAIAVWTQSEGMRKTVWARRLTVDTGWGEARRLSAKYRSASAPQIAMNKGGDALVIWKHGLSVWARRFSPSLEWTPAEQVHEADVSLEEVTLSIDDSGNGTVAWTDYRQVFARRYTSGQGWETTLQEEGWVHRLAFTTSASLITVVEHQRTSLLARPYSLSTGWGKQTHLEQYDEDGEPIAPILPRIATNGSGDAIALWEFEGGIWVQHYHGKTGWDAPRKLADDGKEPDIDINENGHAMVVWDKRGADGQIHAAYHDPEAGWTEPTGIEFERGNERLPLVRLDQGGNAVALWYEINDAGNYRVWSNRYTPGSGWHTAEVIAAIPDPGPPYGANLLLDLAVSNDGEAIASWRADGKYHANLWVAHWTTDSEPWLSRVSDQPTQPASGRWQTAALVEDRTTPAFSPSVARNSNGRTIAVWRQEDAIWASHRLPGEPWQPAQRIGDEADRASHPKVAINANGRATAAWRMDWGASLQAAHYTPGNGWQPAETIQASDRGLHHENLQLAVTPDGATVIAWDQSPDVEPPEVSNILELLVSQNPEEIHGVWASIYRDDEGWSQPESLQSLPTNDTRGIPTTPKLAVDGNGNAVIAWKQINDDRDAIWATHYHADRNWLARLMGDWTTSERIAQHDSRNADILDLAVNEDGEAIALWQNDSELWVNHYSPNEGWQTAQAIPADPKGYFPGPSSAAIAFGPDGTAMAVWPKRYTADRRIIGDTGSEALWAAQYLPQSGWREAEFLWTYNRSEFKDLDLTMDQRGNALLVWQQNGPPPYSPMDAGGIHTVALRYEAVGGWGLPQYIGPKITGTADSLALDGNRHGDAVAVWTKGGSLWSSDFTVSDTAATGASRDRAWEPDETFQTEGRSPQEPRMAASENGDVFALWVQRDYDKYRVWTNRHGPATGWGTPHTIGVCDHGAYDGKPAIAADAQGNAMAVWQHDDAFWARYYRSGQGWKPAFRLSSPDRKTAFSPQVAMHPDGQALVVWAETTKDNRTDLRARQFLPAQGWQPAELLENNDHDSYYSDVKSPRVAFAANGNAFAVWQQGAPRKSSIWANRYTAGKGWQGPELVETQNRKGATRPQLAVDAHGNALVTWEQDTAGFWSNHYRAGQGWQQPRLIPGTDKTPRQSPKVTLDNKGNAMLIWRQDQALRAVTSTLGGVWSPSQRVTHNEDDTRDDHLIYTDHGFLVAWNQDGLWTRRYIPGQGWEKPRKMDWGHGARIAITETNADIIAWMTNNRFHLRRWTGQTGN